MDIKEILRSASGKFEALAGAHHLSSGRVFEVLAKHDPLIPRNEDPDLARLEQKVIIPLMKGYRLYTPDIILMSYDEDSQTTTIHVNKIGEIKLGFGKIDKAIFQQTHFFPDLKKFLAIFNKLIKERGLVFKKRRPWEIKVMDDCSLFYVLPLDINLPKEIAPVEVFHSSFSSAFVSLVARSARKLPRF